MPDDTELVKVQSVMIKAAKRAGNIVRKNWGNAGKIGYKGRIDLVTETDFLSEKAILDTLISYYPESQILSEEAGLQNRTGKNRFIIDPLDGTTNYAHAYPCFCVSIAFEKEGKIMCAVVYEPLLDEMYTAIAGRGAYLNSKPISVSAAQDLDKSLLVTGFPYDIRDNTGHNFKYFNHLLLKAQSVRRDGSAAIDLCYVAAGRYDGFWELGLAAWDVAAGGLILTEAGGMVSYISDDKFSIEGKQILATNGFIHEQLRSQLHIAEKNL